MNFVESFVGFVGNWDDRVANCVHCAEVLVEWGITERCGELHEFHELCDGPSASLPPALAMVRFSTKATQLSQKITQLLTHSTHKLV